MLKWQGYCVDRSSRVLTKLADEITEELKKGGLVLGTFMDEFQMNLKNHPGSDFVPASYVDSYWSVQRESS